MSAPAPLPFQPDPRLEVARRLERMASRLAMVGDCGHPKKSAKSLRSAARMLRQAAEDRPQRGRPPR